MACNCGGRKKAAQPRKFNGGTTASSGTGAEQNFSVIFRDGSPTQNFGSRLEADAANARAGYTGIVRQNRR